VRHQGAALTLSLASGNAQARLPRPLDVQQGSTATGADAGGFAKTREDGDLHTRTLVDGLPVVCKQGVRGSSPLSSTGQRNNSNSRADSTAAKYSNRERVGCRTRVEWGSAPPRGCGLRRTDPRFWAGIRAALSHAGFAGSSGVSSRSQAVCRCRELMLLEGDGSHGL